MRITAVCLSAVLVLGGSFASAQDLPLNHEDAGVEVLVGETIFFSASVAMGQYWEPFTDIFGDGVATLIAGAYPDGQETGFNSKVAFFYPNGTIEEYWAFYADNGQPYTGPFNEARAAGNPPRIAADRTPGGTRYITGQESTPFLYPQFDTDGRWDQEFFYVGNQIAAVQLFNRTPNGPQPITHVIDPVYGRGDIDGVQNNQMRFGGDVRFLSNGNALVVVEDRNGYVAPGTASIASIFDGETGELIVEPFNASGDGSSRAIWSNVVAFNGGFAVRTEGGILSIFNNDGELQHVVDQEEWTNVVDRGRGDGTRITSNIELDHIYILGKDPVGDMVVSTINAITAEAGEEVVVNELELWDFGTFDRGDVAVDNNGNVCVTYEFTNPPANRQMVARILDNNLEPVTSTFFVFENFERGGDAILGFESKESNVSMDNQRIIIATNGVTMDPSTGALTPPEHTFAIVFRNPFGEETPVTGWELY